VGGSIQVPLMKGDLGGFFRAKTPPAPPIRGGDCRGDPAGRPCEENGDFRVSEKRVNHRLTPTLSLRER